MPHYSKEDRQYFEQLEVDNRILKAQQSLGVARNRGVANMDKREKKSNMKYEQREFEGNIKITISDNEVRLWVCNQKGINIFRFKAMGEVHRVGQDITILPRT